MNGTVIQKFFAFLKLLKFLGNFCFSEQIFHRKQLLGAPDVVATVYPIDLVLYVVKIIPPLKIFFLTGVLYLINGVSKDERRGIRFWGDVGDTCLIQIDV